MMHVPLCDLAPQHDAIAVETAEAVRRVVASQRFILGEEVSSFEREFSQKIAISHTVGVASGSDALALALLAVGVSAGDAVVTTPYTFVATASAIARVGATPIFVDLQPGGVQIDPVAVKRAIANATEKKISAIAVVHLFGELANVDALAEIAKENNVPLVEDAAQAFGATLRGRAAGTFGVAGCFSFFPSKTLGAWGDGGAVVTNDPRIAERLRSLRAHGFERARGYIGAGDNSRLDAIQAAVLRVKLKHVDAWIAGRRKLVGAYRSHFSERSNIIGEAITLPFECGEERATFNPFVVRATRRDALAAHLHDRGVEARAYYTRLLSAEPRFASSLASPMPHAEEAAQSRLALPLFFGMTEEQVAFVVRAVADFYAA